MFRKIANTLREGDAKTKRVLILMIVLVVLSIGTMVAAFVVGSFGMGLIAAFVGLITWAVISEKSFTTGNANGKNKKTSQKKKKNKKASQDGKNSSQKTSPKKKSSSENDDENGETNEEDTEDEEEKDDEQDSLSKDSKESGKEDEEEGPVSFGGDALGNMTEEKLKKLFKFYKVKQEHVPVVVDLCVREHVKQAPGFAWLAEGKLKILLIEGKPRLMERSYQGMQVLEVEKGVSVRASSEYAQLRTTDLMRKVFTPYLPKYHEKSIGGRRVLLKNLYVLDDDIKFTSGSVNKLKQLLPLRIEFNDRRMAESNVSAYYKDLFSASFLWQDGVISLEEYKNRVEKMLDDMAMADIAYSEFENNLSEMISDGLLPSEYRKYAYDKREKKNAPPEEEKKKGKKKKEK